MRRPFWILALVAVAVPSHAKTRVGALGGLSLARLHFSPDEPGVSFGTATGFAGGVLVDVGLGKRLALNFEPMYVRKGGEINVALGDSFAEGFAVSLRLDYLELPVLLKVRFGEGGVRPYLLAGPTAGYRLSAKATAEGETMDTKDTFEEWDFGISAGAGLAFPAGKATAFLEARYGLGLVNVGKETNEDESLKTRTLLVLAGVSFGGGR